MPSQVKEQREERILDGVRIWCAYYRANIHRFAHDYLGVTLHLFQKILLYMMNINNYFAYIAARGQGKSYLVAIFCCCRCILYPGTKICIASGTKNQAINIIEKKIKLELLPNSPNLQKEIKNTTVNSQKALVEFHNGSYIEVVTANDNARGGRANIFIFDEFRMISFDILDDVLKKYLASEREPGFLNNYSKAEKKRYQKEHGERNKQIYLSSAYFKDHWSYKEVQDLCKGMIGGKSHSFVCGLPYQLSVYEGLLNEESVQEEMAKSTFNEIKWSMEMECLWFGDIDGSFFDFESVSKNRKIKYPMLPDDISSKLPNGKDFKIQPKQNGEKRILSADIALMSSKKNNNDASAIFINQLIPTKANRYMNNIIYSETWEGKHTADQALDIRKLFDEYNCDYIVIDAKGVGAGVTELLVRDITDSESGEIYPALSSCNNDELAKKCSNPNAAKVIWAINASSKFNSDCAFLLRESFKSGKVRLLQSEYDAEEMIHQDKSIANAFSKLNEKDKIEFLSPYINTTLLINELINLKHEENNGLVRVYEKSGMRKDRYSSLSYSHYVACQLEMKLNKRNRSVSESVDSLFMFRAPKIR